LCDVVVVVVVVWMVAVMVTGHEAGCSAGCRCVYPISPHPAQVWLAMHTRVFVVSILNAEPVLDGTVE
jgi:hypothetical protein